MQLRVGLVVVVAVVCGNLVACEIVAPAHRGASRVGETTSNLQCFAGSGLALRDRAGISWNARSLCSHRPTLQARRRSFPLLMSEIPWEPSAKPENDVGYSTGDGACTRSLAIEAKESAKFLGDLPRQRVFVTATIECPDEALDAEESKPFKKPSYRGPSNDPVDEVQESLQMRSKLHRMMHLDVIDAYTGGQEKEKGGAKLHLKFGNANGFFRRWPEQQYTITLTQVGNNEFEVSPESCAESMSDMGIVSLRARYIAGERLLKVSGFMDGADIEGELRAVPMLKTPANQHVY